MAEPFDLPIRMTAPTREDLSRRNISKSENAAAPVTPPARYISSTYSTPGSTFGQEQDAIIIELNSRYIKAGIEGESYPQCRYNFTPSVTKRVGDYRQYLPNYVRPKESLDTWGEGYELWKSDIRGMSLGLLSDNLERAIREMNNKHLLVDAGIARLILVVPSLLPHPVLSTVLQTLFERWTYPSITLLPTHTTALVAAGLRSGLVVDMDWEETVVTAVYEYREVRSNRTTRAIKMMTKDAASWMKESLQPEDRFDLEFVEEVLKRIGEHVCTDGTGPDSTEQTLPEEKVTIDWPTDNFSRPVSFSKRGMRAQMMETLLGKEGESYPDDEELPLQRVIYNTLLAVPPDIRGICVSRLVFTGNGSENKGMVAAVVKSFTNVLEDRGWTGIQGSKLRAIRASRAKRANRSEPPQAGVQSADAKRVDDVLPPEGIVLAEERHLREKAKHIQPVVHGCVRQVESLGPWCGASLMTALKVKSFVEIQRERFLAHGLGGASRELDLSVVPQQSRGPLSTRSKAGERTSWTLSGWG